MPQKTRKISKSTSFEDALAELEGIVQTLESGEQSLEASLEQFERGVSLSRHCQESLISAEQKVSKLLNDDTLEPFRIGNSTGIGANESGTGSVADTDTST